ncbi:MAG TPA: hypothetical protein VL494_13460 [Steroidobacteraceae bacterium]|nr:hypothetical protein [Steroidobacteraceae bacterium]
MTNSALARQTASLDRALDRRIALGQLSTGPAYEVVRAQGPIHRQRVESVSHQGNHTVTTTSWVEVAPVVSLEVA